MAIVLVNKVTKRHSPSLHNSVPYSVPGQVYRPTDPGTRAIQDSFRGNFAHTSHDKPLEKRSAGNRRPYGPRLLQQLTGEIYNESMIGRGKFIR